VNSRMAACPSQATILSASDDTACAAVQGGITLVVQGHSISADRVALATISKFFKALFQPRFKDSCEPVLSLDSSGEMGLTAEAVKVLTLYAKTRKLDISGNTAIQIFIAADALDAENIRRHAETYMGRFLLQKENFGDLWKLSRQFYMKILESFMDNLVLENFGWFSDNYSLPLYLRQWNIDQLSTALLQTKFRNCSEEQIFKAVVSYCRGLGNQSSGLDTLAPGLYKSCGNYLRFVQSVPRTVKYQPVLKHLSTS